MVAQFILQRRVSTYVCSTWTEGTAEVDPTDSHGMACLRGRFIGNKTQKLGLSGHDSEQSVHQTRFGKPQNLPMAMTRKSGLTRTISQSWGTLTSPRRFYLTLRACFEQPFGNPIHSTHTLTECWHHTVALPLPVPSSSCLVCSNCSCLSDL